MVARDRLNDWADRENGGRLVTNVVMMGMGEPLYNFEAVRDALLIVSDNEGIGISAAASRCPPRAWCRTSSAPARRSA
jgi:23S rRNA (adenine2503-C2)-methyltransferase